MQKWFFSNTHCQYFATSIHRHWIKIRLCIPKRKKMVQLIFSSVTKKRKLSVIVDLFHLAIDGSNTVFKSWNNTSVDIDADGRKFVWLQSWHIITSGYIIYVIAIQHCNRWYLFLFMCCFLFCILSLNWKLLKTINRKKMVASSWARLFR